MAKKIIVEPEHMGALTWKNDTGVLVPVGRLVRVMDHFAVAETDIANLAVGVLKRECVVSLPKATGFSLVKGQGVGFSPANNGVQTSYASGFVGTVYKDAGTNDTEVQVAVGVGNPRQVRIARDVTSGEDGANQIDIDVGFPVGTNASPRCFVSAMVQNQGTGVVRLFAGAVTRGTPNATSIRFVDAALADAETINVTVVETASA
jgi:predicted RecA/RadA family phage recombinase